MVASPSARRSAPSVGGDMKHDPAALAIHDMSLEEHVIASSSRSEEVSVGETKTVESLETGHVEYPTILPDESTATASRIHILDLPIELIEMLCREYLDICSNTCLGLTCKTFFNMTEHINPFQVNLHMRTSGICLGRLLTTWMAPKYSFNHSWGKFLLKRHYNNDEAEVERRWKEKEQWKKIRLSMDSMGYSVAYESRSKRRGF
ncbi:hypothetical protein BKA65DRAFT_546637 [Rhexocercosporidium sp. MPI-PUGE-AT-0058]|nr:hypothetical protein BKA65DRAFT_546637 [Rhexocercosporidium sp. MPI-PUGE-AT-0058]